MSGHWWPSLMSLISEQAGTVFSLYRREAVWGSLWCHQGLNQEGLCLGGPVVLLQCWYLEWQHRDGFWWRVPFFHLWVIRMWRKTHSVSWQMGREIKKSKTKQLVPRVTCSKEYPQSVRQGLSTCHFARIRHGTSEPWITQQINLFRAFSMVADKFSSFPHSQQKHVWNSVSQQGPGDVFQPATVKRTHTYNNFLSGRGDRPKFDPSTGGGGGGSTVHFLSRDFPGITLFTQYQGVQYVCLVPADTHISQPGENAIFPSQQNTYFAEQLRWMPLIREASGKSPAMEYHPTQEGHGGGT